MRSSAWYWVRVNNKYVWTVAHYNAAHKQWTMEGRVFNENEFIEIGFEFNTKVKTG